MLLTPAEFAATQEKIAKVNDRAAKRGWTGRVELTGTKVEKTETGPSGLSVKLQLIEATITGEPPRYKTADGKDWQFLARAEFDKDSGLVVYSAPGAPDVDRESIRPGECDHCGIDRYRKHVYLVSDGERQLQVGSTCLKDFLGWNINPAWISEPSLSDYEPDGGYGHTEPTYATDTVLAAAWACIEVYGYVKSDDWSRNPTKYAVLSVLQPRNKADRGIAEEVAPQVADAYAMAAKIRAFILSDEFSGSGDYVANLKNIARGDWVAFKRFGFLVSAPQAWAKAQERDLIQRTEGAELLNEWNGTLGEKLELTVTVKSVRHVDTRFGVSHLYTMVGDDKRTYKWWASNEVWEAPFNGEPVKIRGTIKDHDIWEGRKSTVLTRVKVVKAD